MIVGGFGRVSPALLQEMALTMKVSDSQKLYEIYMKPFGLIELSTLSTRIRKQKRHATCVDGLPSTSPNLIQYDKEAGRLTIKTDLFGMTPLYYTLTDDGLYFASQIKALLLLKEFDVDWHGIADFLAFGFHFGEKTWFKGINCLDASSILTYDGANIHLHRNEGFKYEPNYDIHEDRWLKLLASAFLKAAEMMMSKSGTFGILMGGGLDSRGVLASIPKERRNRVAIVTHAVPETTEAHISRKVSERSAVKQIFLSLDPYEMARMARHHVWMVEGGNLLASYLLSLKEIKGIDYLVHGFMGDLFFGGSHLSADMFDMRRGEIKERLQKDLTRFSDNALKELLTSSAFKKIKGLASESFSKAFSQIRSVDPANICDEFTIKNYCRRSTAVGRIIYRSFTEDDFITLDPRLTRLVFSLPPELRIGHKVYQKVLISLDRELFKITYLATGMPPTYPRSFWKHGYRIFKWRNYAERAIYMLLKKRIPLQFLGFGNGFTDEYWYVITCKAWRNLFSDLLFGKLTVERGFYRTDITKRMWEHYTKTMIGRQRIATLATLESWLRSIENIRTECNNSKHLQN